MPLPPNTPPSTHPVTSSNVQSYYDWLYGQYYQGINEPTVRFDVRPIFWEFMFMISLILFFYLFSKHFLFTRRERGELYGITSYAGNILERNGKVSILGWVTFVFLIVWALSFIVRHIVFGQVY